MPGKIYSYSINDSTIFIEASDNEIEREDNDEIITVSSKDNRDSNERSFEKLLSTLENISNSVSKTAKALQPDEFEIELGLSMSGQMGIPFITKAASEGTFKVTIKWKKDNNTKNEESK